MALLNRLWQSARLSEAVSHTRSSLRKVAIFLSRGAALQPSSLKRTE